MSQRKGRLDGRCEPIAAAGSSLSQLRIRPGLRKYIAVRSIVPATLSYAVLRHFHAAAAMTMVATSSLRQELSARGFRKLGTWTRGVDTDLFTPDDAAALDLPRPIFMTVGRVAVEKNLEAFLSLDLPGSKVVIGSGPQKAVLERRYPKARFLGEKTGRDLTSHLAAAASLFSPAAPCWRPIISSFVKTSWNPRGFMPVNP
jgi:glycosyltransferase involved in cell wall biosynthesis